MRQAAPFIDRTAITECSRQLRILRQDEIMNFNWEHTQWKKLERSVSQ